MTVTRLSLDDDEEEECQNNSRMDDTIQQVAMTNKTRKSTKPSKNNSNNSDLLSVDDPTVSVISPPSCSKTVPLLSSSSSSSSSSHLRNEEIHHHHQNNFWIATSPIPVENKNSLSLSSNNNHSYLTHAQQVNQQQLRLNLGLSFLLQPNHVGVRRVMKILDQVFFAWYERFVFGIWKSVLPLSFRQSLAFYLWKYYFLPLHRNLLGKSTGIHQSASYEFHALTTLMYFGRFFPNTINRMRFALSQVCVIARPLGKVKHLDVVPEQYQQQHLDWKRWIMTATTTSTTESVAARSTKDNTTCFVEQVSFDMKHTLLHLNSEMQEDLLLVNNPTIVQGAYVHVHQDNDHDIDDSNNNTDKNHIQPVVLWFYGGAFLAGDVPGNLEHAKYVAMAVGCDVFVPHYRLVPEVHLNDQIWDTTMAYRYLILERNIPPCQIFLWGISSGAGLALRLAQNASWMIMYSLQQQQHNVVATANSNNNKDGNETNGTQIIPATVQPLLTNLFTTKTTTTSTTTTTAAAAAMGVILLCPFVDYTVPPLGGSFLEYSQHDLIVNQSVLEEGLPYLEKVLGTPEQRRQASPLYGSFPNNKLVSLPPVCIVVSEHETVYDQTMELVQSLEHHNNNNNNNNNKIHVTLGVWKYMFHVFCMMYGYLPEGMQAMQFCLRWIVQQKHKATKT